MGSLVRLAALVLLVGCGASTRVATATPDAGCVGDSCPSSTCVPTSPTASTTTYDYVINTLTIDDNTDFSQPHYGFNVDGAWSPPHPAQGPPNCNHQDYFSVLDPDQNESGGACLAGLTHGGPGCIGGVDNQLPVLAQIINASGTDFGMEWQNEIDQGRLTLLIQVGEVEGIPGPGIPGEVKRNAPQIRG